MISTKLSTENNLFCVNKKTQLHCYTLNGICKKKLILLIKVFKVNTRVEVEINKLTDRSSTILKQVWRCRACGVFRVACDMAVNSTGFCYKSRIMGIESFQLPRLFH